MSSILSMPTGTITFLFTDIEGSTKLWDRYPEGMRRALACHDKLLQQAIEQHHGHVFKTVGDAFCAAFPTAPDALAAALEAHLALQQPDWGEVGSIRVRMGLHTGEAEERDNDYFGPTLNRVARLQGVGHGQQTLLSQATYELVRDSLPPDVTLQDMGQHRLKDLLAPEHVWQIFHPALPTEFPSLKSLDYLPTNLPRQMTSFIGRQREMEEIKRLLTTTPLLTLLGIGGVGKTRLSVQVGADLVDHYKDGVWLVELAALTEPELVPQAIASVLSIREEANRPLLQTLTDALRDKQILLLLDNCEHLINACARVADTLLKSCSHLTILATSRERLGISGEHAWRIPSLLAPTPEDTLLVDQETIGQEATDPILRLMEYDAPRLFVERARQQRQDFTLYSGNVAAIAHLCRQLDGIPLAIELAAARTRSLSVEEIDSKLDNRFRLLTGGSRAALPRQQTLRALIDWSYDLLNDQEKTLLACLSVFAGGWFEEAAEQVCAGEEIEDWEVLDILGSLVDKSLVAREEQEGHTRYRLLETVRQYATEKLQSHTAKQDAQQKHQDYYLTLAKEANSQLTGSQQAAWLDTLEREHDNLRAALNWQVNDTSLCLAGTLWRFWEIRGYFAEGREQLTRLMAQASQEQATTDRVDALRGVGALAWAQGDYTYAQDSYQQSLELSEKLRYRIGIALALSGLGNIAYAEQNAELARSLHLRCLQIQQEIGDEHGMGVTLNSLGNIALHQQQDQETARRSFEESLRLLNKCGDKRYAAIALSNLSVVAYMQGHNEELRVLGAQCLAIYRQLGDKFQVAVVLNNIAEAAFRMGNYADARRMYAESLRLFQQLGNRQYIPYVLESLAYLNAALEQWPQMVRLMGAAEAQRETVHVPLPPSDAQETEAQLAIARSHLGETAYAAEWAAGRCLTLEEAIAYALQTAPSPRA